MSSTVERVICPKCGKSARQEQNNCTLEVHIHCPVCGYDSDIDEGFVDYDEIDDLPEN